MNLSAIIQTRVYRYFRTSADSNNVYMLDLTNGIQERYRFLQVPRTIEEFDASKGVLFRHGQHGKTIIDSMRVFSSGVSVEARTRSANVDAFIDDSIGWVSEEFDLRIIEDSNLQRSYGSYIEVEMDKPIAEKLRQFEWLADYLTERVSGYNTAPCGAFEPTGLVLHNDVTKERFVKPGKFILERRAGQPFESNLFYSEAPLTTDDHLAALERLAERL